MLHASQVAALLRAGADDTALAAAVTPMIISRLIGGKDIPKEVVVAARSVLNHPSDILRYNAGQARSCCRGLVPAPPCMSACGWRINVALGSAVVQLAVSEHYPVCLPGPVHSSCMRLTHAHASCSRGGVRQGVRLLGRCRPRQPAAAHRRGQQPGRGRQLHAGRPEGPLRQPQRQPGQDLHRPQALPDGDGEHAVHAPLPPPQNWASGACFVAPSALHASSPSACWQALRVCRCRCPAW